MADYHPLIARAVASLDKNSGENRRALYERARTALVAQLRGVVPPLDESEITRERLALEEAIRKVEAESARHARETARPAFIKRATEATRREEVRRDDARREQPPRDEPQREETRREETHREEARPPPAAAISPRSGPARSRVAVGSAPASAAPAQSAPSPTGEAAAAARQTNGRRSLADEAMRGFREVVADPDAATQPDPPAYRSGSGLPPAPSLPPVAPAVPEHPLHEFGQLEPQVQSEALWTPPVDESRDPSQSDDYQAHAPPMAPGSEEPEEALERPRGPPRSYGRLIRITLTLLLLLGAGAVAYYQRDTIGDAAGTIAALVRPSSTPPREAAAPSRKIPDRIGQPTTQPAAGPAVAQRVVLYEEDPDDPQGKRFVGAVIWRTETRPATPGRLPELAVRADIEVPDRKMTVTWSLRRNTDQSLPASHTIEIMFNLPAESQSGGVQNVPGVLMKQAEQTRGVPLAGLAVKVTPGFFLIGLSALETDMQRNLQLLKERSWFDIPIVYNNNRRAILAMEKGTPGERAFADAFTAWRQ
jgi:hypothetical protein